MTIQSHEITPAVVGPPTPARLDGVLFISVGPESESAWHDGLVIGELHHDDESDHWVARYDDLGWRKMRCRAEARAKIVSAFRAMASSK